ncbi:MAG: choline ABC transporter substrate-binding protein [Rhodobacteraceae bacterium]|jgi:glycine betaine/proline transport system substrate-binding protein|uniref:Glycine betaine/proline transport system substrate-binding protein n=1 Tax=Salipiger profundus TaxID=1229727 RepID=A0A1U7D9B3_9RHOB|nr:MULTISPECIES: choline ABC transporter substrate-binding protein [Salipiger]APX24692.1 glycine betaine/proline transport system substrate-binding protein [Salipiger profundus]MAB09241.1 choline ABC transporter substrate-binding protein [Paracoccaceae bacterium]GFZ97105.1 glycine/betaine ABC transporter substrate-binding protein [Salipiger profundus]SFD01943.1 glycine betaine/proline transport system substrate-binding protein [Salipiger profundus]
MKACLPVAGLLAVTTTAMPALADCSTVRLAEPGWTDLALTTAVTQVLLEGMGHETETEILGIPVIYEAMKAGDLDVFMGYWDPAMETYFNAYRDTGEIETIHTNLEGAKFTWAVPSYVHEAGVTSFADLAAQEDKFGGKLYGIEPGSNDIMLEIVEKDEFGLGDWDVVESSEQGMLAQVAREVRSEDWIVFLAWAPHPMNTNFDIAYLEGGDAWYGPDFGGATVSTQVREGYVSECPEVGKLLTQLTFDVDMESEGMGYILEDGMPPKEAARTLIAAYPDRLQGWLDGVETVDGAPALAAVKSDLGL